MKRIISIAVSLFYCALLFISLVILLKPGASIFYKKSQIQTQTITHLDNTFKIQYKIDTYLYDPDTLILFEDGNPLTLRTIKDAKAGKKGVFALDDIRKVSLSVLFNPTSSSNSLLIRHNYTIYIRSYLFSRVSGVVFFILFLLGFLAISLIDPVHRKMVLHSPVGIVRLWINGTAGSSICRYLGKFNINLIIRNILFPLILLVLYCGIFTYYSSWHNYSGVNYNFVSILWRYLFIVIIVIVLFVYFISKLKNNHEVINRYSYEKFAISDLLLILFPLTPVVQYIIINQESLSFAETTDVLCFFVLFTSLFVIILPVLLGIFSSNRSLMSMGLAFIFTLTNMATLSDELHWYSTGSLWIQLVILLGIFLVSRFLNRKILYLFIVINLVSNGAYQIISRNSNTVSSLPIEENALLISVKDRKVINTPSIYLLVYDAYVANETMLQYGFDNSSQEDYLVGNGFKLYPHTYTIGSSTVSSMSRVLNASTEYYGNSRRGVSGNGIVQNLLKNDGYETWGLFTSGYMFLGTGSSYDYFLPEGQINSSLTEGILLGEFRFDLGFYEQSKEEFLVNKQIILENISGNPVFIYMHSNIPGHSQTSGTCIEDDTGNYLRDVERANLEMKQDVDTIIENDPEALIIVAGDHGPRLTKNCLFTTGHYDISEISRRDVQDRVGSFLAIRWPTDDYEKYDDITVLQDIFPAVFAYLYEDTDILNTKVEPVTLDNIMSGVIVDDGIIYGGKNDGELLYLSGN